MRRQLPNCATNRVRGANTDSPRVDGGDIRGPDFQQGGPVRGRGGAAVSANGLAGYPEWAALGQSGCGDGDPLRVPGAVPCAKTLGHVGTRRGAASGASMGPRNWRRGVQLAECAAEGELRGPGRQLFRISDFQDSGSFAILSCRLCCTRYCRLDCGALRSVPSGCGAGVSCGPVPTPYVESANLSRPTANFRPPKVRYCRR